MLRTCEHDLRLHRPSRAAAWRLARAAALTGGVVLLSAANAGAQLTRVTVGHDGSVANGSSFLPAITGDGRYVAFTSIANNLVPDDHNQSHDIFVRDLVANTTTRVSVTSAGAEAIGSSHNPSISDDGNIIVFDSIAKLAPEATRICSTTPVLLACANVYVHNRTTGETTVISVTPDGITPANSDSDSPKISADGRYVVYRSAATDIVPGDTNGVVDIFLYDRVAHTNTRVSLDSLGRQGALPSGGPVISADGKVVAFVSGKGSFETVASDETQAEAPCSPRGCNRIFVRTLASAELRRLRLSPAPIATTGGTAIRAFINGDGRYIAESGEYATSTNELSVVRSGFLYDLVTGQRISVGALAGSKMGRSPVVVALSRNGRYVAGGGGGDLFANEGFFWIVDRVTGMTDVVRSGAFGIDSPERSGFDATGRRFVFVAGNIDNLPDPGFGGFVFMRDSDADGDGMPAFWETQFGLNPADPTDAGADPDGDGLTNLQEFQANSHPTATQTRYFAEGAANSFFSARIAVVNPSETTPGATVMLRLLGSNGQQTSITRTVLANQRTTFELTPDINLPDSVFSTIVESDQPVVSDRLMSWDATGYGSHLETSVAAPGTTWYFAEGASGSPYSLYYLLQNPGAIDATVTVTYLLPSPQAPITKSYDVAAHSRMTIDVTGEAAALAHAEVSAKIVSTQPIVAERAQYLSTPTQINAAGHAGAAIAAPATRWFLAEGSTGFFDEYVLIANAEPTAANITVTYLLEGGTPPFSESFTVEANSRYTVDLKARDPRLKSAAVSVIVESTNATPVIVERVMWWPHGNWYEASLSAGVTTTGTKWAIAEGELGGPFKSQTYVLIANTDPARTAKAVVKLLMEDGTTRDAGGGDVAPNSRLTVDIGAGANPPKDLRFGIIVDSTVDDVPIVVERSLFSTVGGVLWAAGGTSIATNITPVP
jgi:Tol biopolymer transport system component